MRIAHVSDIHIRNFKYRDEYRAAFAKLYRHLSDVEPDLIINTGDTVHSKLAVSPELFDVVADHMLMMTQIADYWLILGNHDLNLRNKARTDAISPIVRALQGRTGYALKLLGPGVHTHSSYGSRDFRFWNYDIRGHEEFEPSGSHINVGLYHGSVSGCQTDMGFVMEHGERELVQFNEMDYVLMGDIHKRQSFRNGRIQYPGSLIQQNYGEELVKGFLVWDIESKDRFKTSFYQIDAPGRFFTIQVPASLDLEGIDVPKGSRIKALVSGELTPSKRMELERKIREQFDPLEVITPDPSAEKQRLDELTIERLVGSRERMMRDHLEELGCTQEQVTDVIQLWNRYLAGIEDAAARGTTWNLKRFSWDNFMNYGEGNSLEMANLKGLVGVFAPNASGKSTIFDVLLEGLFDKLSKDAPRNIDLINDNRDKTRMVVEFESNGQPYTIEREIERITYGQRKLAETKQWGKMTLDFENDGDSLNGDSRPETERAIRSIIGTYEDFTLTTMVTQNPNFGLPGGGDIINCKETDRRKILFRFLDLDVFEKVHQACKDDLKQALAGQKRDRLEILSEISVLDDGIVDKHRFLAEARATIEDATAEVAELNRTLQELGADRIAEMMVEFQRADDRLSRRQGDERRAYKAARAATEKQERLEDEYIQHLKTEPRRPQIDVEDLSAKVEELRSKQLKMGRELTDRTLREERGKVALKILEEVPCEGKFPTCRFISDAVLFKTERPLLEQAIMELNSQHVETVQELNSLKELEIKHRDVVRWEARKSELLIELAERRAATTKAVEAYESAVAELRLAEKTAQEAKEKLTAADMGRIHGIRDRITKLQDTISRENTSVEALLRGIGASDARRQDLQKELSAIDEMTSKVATYERLAEMTGKNGLPLRILTLVLPVINAEIEKILGGVVKFNVFFEHNADEQSVSLFIRYGDYRSRPLSLGSGAEKFIASLAIRVALLSVSSLPKTDILIVDEGFGKLDPEHLESLQRMFEYLRDAFGTVFLVSHVDSMRDMVDHSLEITSLDGYAHLEA